MLVCFDFLTDVFFLLDILLNFRTGYYDDAELITEPSMIAANVRAAPIAVSSPPLPHARAQPRPAPPRVWSRVSARPLPSPYALSTCEAGSSLTSLPRFHSIGLSSASSSPSRARARQPSRRRTSRRCYESSSYSSCYGCCASRASSATSHAGRRICIAGALEPWKRTGPFPSLIWPPLAHGLLGPRSPVGRSRPV